jgi:hypothetical protein
MTMMLQKHFYRMMLLLLVAASRTVESFTTSASTAAGLACPSLVTRSLRRQVPVLQPTTRIATTATTIQLPSISQRYHAKTKNHPVVLFSSSASSSTPSSDSSKKSPLLLSRTTLGIAVWFVSLSFFIVQNYKFGPRWIPLFSWNKQVWVLIHALCNMFFSGGIVLSTLLEWRVVSSAAPDVIYFWFTRIISKIDKAIVLPALTGSIVAGFAQTALDYGSMATAPKHIRLAIHILATFALWWMATDLTTQQRAKTSVEQWYKNAKQDKQDNSSSATADLPKVLYVRRYSNLVSCFFVAALYALMALKPGYTP